MNNLCLKYTYGSHLFFKYYYNIVYYKRSITTKKKETKLFSEKYEVCDTNT